MATRIEIIQMAVRRLAETPGNTIENSEANALANQWFDQVYSELLIEHLWLFSLRQISPALVDDGDVYDNLKYKYMLPNNFLGVIETNPENIEYKCIGKYLFSDYDSIVDIKIKYKPEVADMPEWFVIVMNAKLAASIAYSLSRKSDMTQYLDHQSRELIAKYHMYDGQQQHTESQSHHDFCYGTWY